MLHSVTHTGHLTSLFFLLLTGAALLLSGCQSAPMTPEPQGETFGDAVAFMRQHTDVIVLSDEAGQAQIAIAPEYQGKVMTSTAGGDDGLSYGWINRHLIASGERRPHINAFGGEDRFWLGPEGGQYSIFFAPGSDFVLADWQTPAPIDWGAWEVTRQARRSLTLREAAQMQNYSGFTFDLEINRIIRLLYEQQAVKHLGMPIPADVECVAYESDNRITNRGEQAWTKETGLLSIWILGMYQASPETTVVVPFRAADVSQEQIVNDAYFGEVPADRLVVRPEQGVLFFSGDGNYRSKIGVKPDFALPVLGSYDAANQVLTIVQFSMPDGPAEYVNSMWEWQDDPFAGDVINSYNDDGAIGAFYELETSSPALALEPGKSARHVHRTYHLRGPAESLDPIARELFGVSLEEVATALDAPAE
jgi:hypothetical protein